MYCTKQSQYCSWRVLVQHHNYVSDIENMCTYTKKTSQFSKYKYTKTNFIQLL